MMKPRALKTQVYGHVARIGKALASGPRLEILDLLAQGPRTVEAIAAQVGQSVANTSQHLQVLRRAQLVEREKVGTYVTYRLADDDVAALFGTLRRLAESRLFEIDQITQQFLEDRDALDPIDRDALVERVRRGEVTVIDVRPEQEFQHGHLPGAVSMPVEELARRMSELPRDREIVAYCRGPVCVMALDAVTQLKAHGYRASRLEDGVADWRARGLPIVAPGLREVTT